MVNSTQVLYFTLGSYLDVGRYRYACFLLLLGLYALILAANLLLILVICRTRSLHEPMFWFLASLSANELLGGTGLFPLLLVQMLSDLHVVPAPLCFLQIFCVYAYGATEFLNLAVMSYDRYLAICFPLRYAAWMSPGKVLVLVALSWLLPLCCVAVLISLSASLQLCGSVIDKVFCGNYSIVKLSCSDTRVHNVYGLAYTAVSVLLPSALIVYTYVKILVVCCSGSRQAREKAVGTCTPHLASVANFCFGCSFQILASRFDFGRLPAAFDVFSSVYFLACQPLLNPLLYGLKLGRIREACRRLLLQRA